MRTMRILYGLSLIGGLFGVNQNLSMTGNKTSKSMIAAGLVAAATIPSYMYYRRSSTNNQKEIQTLEKVIFDLESTIKSTQRDIENVKNKIYIPLPKDYEERKKVATEPHGIRENDENYLHDYDEFKKFIKKFAPPVDTWKDLIKEEQTIYESPDTYNNKQDIFFAKIGSNFDRIVNTERIKKLIKQSQFQHITVPNEYIFFIGDEFFNIADKVKPYKGSELISKAEIEELANFVAATGYSDLSGTEPNIIRSENGTWAFVDTDNEAFNKLYGEQQCENTIENVRHLKQCIGLEKMTSEAIDWLLARIVALGPSSITDSDKECGKNLTERDDLDDHDIDMKAALLYAGGLASRRRHQRLFFGNDPFNQKTYEQGLKELEKSLSEKQTELNQLNDKLVALQNSWYARIRGSWSKFLDVIWAKLQFWH